MVPPGRGTIRCRLLYLGQAYHYRGMMSNASVAALTLPWAGNRVSVMPIN